MFFSGDPSSRRKVDLGGRSNKERDRQKLLEEARLEREKRSRVRLQNQSAGRIQVLVKLLKSFAFFNQSSPWWRYYWTYSVMLRPQFSTLWSCMLLLLLSDLLDISVIV
jgi:hypothetical protein